MISKDSTLSPSETVISLLKGMSTSPKHCISDHCNEVEQGWTICSHSGLLVKQVHQKGGLLCPNCSLQCFWFSSHQCISNQGQLHYIYFRGQHIRCPLAQASTNVEIPIARRSSTLLSQVCERKRWCMLWRSMLKMTDKTERRENVYEKEDLVGREIK